MFECQVVIMFEYLISVFYKELKIIHFHNHTF